MKERSSASISGARVALQNSMTMCRKKTCQSQRNSRPDVQNDLSRWSAQSRGLAGAMSAVTSTIDTCSG